jgi:RimJ/RimL family protein N-acetyltransferase
VLAPEINSDGLLLRPWRAADADAVLRACQDPVLHRWAPELPWPYRRQDAEHYVGVLAPAELAAGRVLGLAITDGRTGAVLGSIALHHPAEIPELGYWVAPWARGHRVAERAGRSLLSWAFTEQEAQRVDWKASIGNHASRLTALRLGFAMIGVRPAAAGTPAKWLASLTPGNLTAAGTDVPHSVRSQAHTFAAAHPTLNAGTLTLRPPAERDVPAVVECRSDPEVARWFGVPQPYTEADARRHVRENVPRRWALGSEAVFAVVDHEDEYQGSVDLRILPGETAVGEVGYLVSPRARGRGYATAALREVCRWGFAALGLARIQWRAEVGNDASRRVAQKAGFTMEGTLRQALQINGVRRDCWVGSLVTSAEVVP